MESVAKIYIDAFNDLVDEVQQIKQKIAKKIKRTK